MLGHIDMLQRYACPVVDNFAYDAYIILGFELKGLMLFIIADH